MKNVIKKTAEMFGYTIIKNPKTWARSANKNLEIPYDMSHDFFTDIYKFCNPFTMTTQSRQFMLVQAIKHLCDNNIHGDIVECGVWRGGSSMIAARSLLQMQETSRQIYLYDTFEGMTAPTEHDTRTGKDLEHTILQFNASKKNDGSNTWCLGTLEEVKENMQKTDYPADRITFVKGDVCKTIPDVIPEKIALLRLDTDFYDLSKHELEHLYPKLVRGGILILDDYGIWDGQRKATDEYFAQSNIETPFLIRVDSACRIAIKP